MNRGIWHKNSRTLLIIFLSVLFCVLLFDCSNNQTNSISEKYTYNEKGLLVSKITPDGNKIKYNYNDKGLPLEIKYLDDTVKYEYDVNGNRVLMQNNTGKTEYAYDDSGRLTDVVFKYSPVMNLKYEYDTWDRVTDIQIIQNDQKVYHVKYDYYLSGNIRSIDNGNERIEYSYSPGNGEIIRKLPNGVKSIFTYSPLGELVNLQHLDPKKKLIASYFYEYDFSGNISLVTERTPESVRTTRYEWDKRGYLKALHLPDGNVIKYSYDSMGNRTSMTSSDGLITYQYDNFGRIIKSGHSKYEWDINGNLTSQLAQGNRTRIIYKNGQLPSLIRTPNKTIHYTWDGDGNLVSTRSGNKTIHYLHNPIAPVGFTLAEYDNTGKINNAYIYGDTLIGQKDSQGKTKYFLEDGFNSIRMTLDQNGRVIGDQEFTPFGQPFFKKQSTTSHFRMAGERILPETGFYIIGTRLYDPEIGRYLAPASFPGYMEKPDSFNKYAHGCYASGSFSAPRCNQTKKGNSGLDYWSGFISSFFGGLPESISDSTKATINFWKPPNIIAGFRGGWDFGMPSRGTFADQAEKYGGPLARKSVQSVLIQGLLIELELLSAGQAHGGMMPKFRYPKKSWWHLGAGEHAANGAIHLGISSSSKAKAVFHFYPSRLFIHGLGDVPYGFMAYLFPSSKDMEEESREIKSQRGKQLKNDLQVSKKTKMQRDCTDCDDEVEDIHINNTYCFWCDDGGGPPGGGGGGHHPGGGGSIFGNPFKSMEAELGGIDLDVEPMPASDLDIGRLKAVVYDPMGEKLVLVGDEKIDIPSIRISDVAEAIDIVNKPECGPGRQCPAFSLEPADPENPDSPAAMIGMIEGDVITGFNNRSIHKTEDLEFELSKVVSDLSKFLEKELKKQNKKPGGLLTSSQYPIEFSRNKTTIKDSVTIEVIKPNSYEKLSSFQLIKKYLGIVPKMSLKSDGVIVKEVIGDKLIKDYIPDLVEGTEIGRIMYVSDWLLKEYSFGVKFVNDKNNISQKERISKVKDYMSEANISLLTQEATAASEAAKTQDQAELDFYKSLRTQARSELQKWISEKIKKRCPNFDITLNELLNDTRKRDRSRIWIEVQDKKVDVYKDNNTIYFEEPKMLVKAMRQEYHPLNKRLEDVSSNNPVAKAFAKECTCFYDDFASDNDEGIYSGEDINPDAFYRLKEYTKALVLAKWLNEKGFNHKDDWIKKNVPAKRNSQQLIRAISSKKERKRNTQYGTNLIKRDIMLSFSSRMFGGVDLTVNPNYITNSKKISPIEHAVMKELKEGVTGKFSFAAGENRYAGIAISLNPGQKKKKARTIEVGSDKYKVGDNGRISEKISPDGTVTEYSYDNKGNLKQVEINSTKEPKIKAFKENNQTYWNVNRSDGMNSQYVYNSSDLLKEVSENGEKIASFEYDRTNKKIEIDYDTYAEIISLSNSGFVNGWRVRDKETTDELTLAFYDSGNISEIHSDDLGSLVFNYSNDDSKLLLIESLRGNIDISYDADNRVNNISLPDNNSIHYTYDEQNLEKISLTKGNNRANVEFTNDNIVRVNDFFGGTSILEYEGDKLVNVVEENGVKVKYHYDKNERINQIDLPDNRRIEYQYSDVHGNKQETSLPMQSVTSITYTSFLQKEKGLTNKDQNENDLLKNRIADIGEAGKSLRNGLIIDLFTMKNDTFLHIADNNGSVKSLDKNSAIEFRKLLKYTSNTKGKLGNSIIKRWEDFFEHNLSSYNKPELWKSHDDRDVKIKPTLIIKSNEVNYKYSNLEKVPVLKDNFLIFIASKKKEEQNLAETTATELVTKINQIPKLLKENVVFTIRPPKGNMTKDMQMEFEQAVIELERLVGEENVLFDPSKKDFNQIFNNQEKEIIVIELTHTDGGITLKDDEIYTSTDVLNCVDLSHIKYLMAGPGTCSLPKLEEGQFAAALREKGVGITNASYGEVNADIILKRLQELIHILEHVDEYDFPAFYIPDIIDQLIGIDRNEKGTTNLGEIDRRRRYFLS